MSRSKIRWTHKVWQIGHWKNMWRLVWRYSFQNKSPTSSLRSQPEIRQPKLKLYDYLCKIIASRVDISNGRGYVRGKKIADLILSDEDCWEGSVWSPPEVDKEHKSSRCLHAILWWADPKWGFSAISDAFDTLAEAEGRLAERKPYWYLQICQLLPPQSKSAYEWMDGPC